LEPQASPRIENWQQAQVALGKYPFQIEVLQKSLTLLNQAKKEKEGYDAALAALQWNENIPVYYLIYAIQAYHIGEIIYGNEAIEALKKLSPSTYEANKTTLSEAQAQATERQKFN
jgi:Arc/MetJ-type ribon-helix-helix transcriptional regulator